MSNDSDELSEFIKSTINGIKKGIDGHNFVIREPIKFDIAVAKVKEGGGGFKIYVVDAGGKYKAEEITKIQFEIQPSMSNDKKYTYNFKCPSSGLSSR